MAQYFQATDTCFRQNIQFEPYATFRRKMVTVTDLAAVVGGVKESWEARWFLLTLFYGVCVENVTLQVGDWGLGSLLVILT